MGLTACIVGPVTLADRRVAGNRAGRICQFWHCLVVPRPFTLTVPIFSLLRNLTAGREFEGRYRSSEPDPDGLTVPPQAP